MATITLQGKEIHTHGELPAVGATAPEFRLVTQALSDVGLAAFAGKRKLLNIVPSLDTPVCALSTRRFNDLARDRDDVAVLIISADLPFAQKRFTEAEGLDHVVTLSVMRSRRFSKDYGVLMEDGSMAGITARAVVVLDGDNRVIHTELVPEIAQEPDYDKAIAALSRSRESGPSV